MAAEDLGSSSIDGSKDGQRLSSFDNQSAPEGWYEDPWGHGSWRWWDGDKWTGKRSITAPTLSPSKPAAVSTNVTKPTRKAVQQAARDAEKKRVKTPSKPPEPSISRKVLGITCSIALFASIAYGIVAFVSDQRANAALVRNGVIVQAKVVSQDHESDDDGAYDYLWVLIPSCQCRVQLPTTNLAGHPVGSKIGVRYDPKNPSDARPMVDNNDVWLLDGFYVALAIFGLCIWWSSMSKVRDQRRSRQTNAKGDGLPLGPA
jgi:Protein of unknown function (DUF2510)